MTAKLFLEKKNIGEHCFQDNGVPEFMAIEMEEYAEQQSIEFAEWMFIHCYYENDKYGFHIDSIYAKTNQQYFSLDELYKLFKDKSL